MNSQFGTRTSNESQAPSLAKIEPHHSRYLESPVEPWLNSYIRKVAGHTLGEAATSQFVDNVLKELEAQESILDNDGWKAIRASRKGGQDEDTIYSHLGTIFEALCKAAKKFDNNLKSTTTLRSNGRLTSILDTFNPKPDFKLYLLVDFYQANINPKSAVPLPSPPFASEAIVDESAKLIKKEKSDGVRLPTWACALVGGRDIKNLFEMQDGRLQDRDPCRRFFFAFTIEIERMRLWHVNRSHICHSQTINIHSWEGRRHLVVFLLFLAFAAPHELGFDPTIERHTVSSGAAEHIIAYEYKVVGKNGEARSYLTQGKPLFKLGTHEICSRATLVWKVREIMSRDADGQFMLSRGDFVLKDVYLRDNAKLESAILEDIFGRLRLLDEKNRETKETTYAKDAACYFMTFIADWCVEINDLREQTPQHPEESWCCSEYTARSTDVAHLQRIHVRKHVRTVLKEVCEPISEIMNYKVMVQVLMDITDALYYLFLAGYVHHDVSAGNCLWDSNGKMGKLSDLEYAKPYTQSNEDDCLTGTPAFMAVEYQRQSNLFPIRKNASLGEIRKGRANISGGDVYHRYVEVKPRFNFYHDAESIIWIFIWYLHHRIPKNFVSNDARRQWVKESAEMLFAANMAENVNRTHLLVCDTTLNTFLENMTTAYSPEFTILSEGVTLCAVLRKRYINLEANSPTDGRWDEAEFDHSLYNSMKEVFQEVFDAMKEEKHYAAERLDLSM